ncbi:MAG: multiheme c-type cytochrome, partial [Planctomycetota bacterium]
AGAAPAAGAASASREGDRPKRALGVCPPYKLRDEEGRVIDPVHGENATVPYSPKRTCGQEGCHDYAKITEGFHFTQGKGEPVPALMAERYRWVSAPGNYGGNWCSPAPLYRQLAPKSNPSGRGIDMTSFEFVTATCGNCHPGGGPMEFDRDGKRYDERMRDPASGFAPGGDNGFDGDYYKARWSETGVIEADCLLCHLPEYDFKRRNAQLALLNFRWAATEGAGFGQVSGSVKDGGTPQVSYDLKRFDKEGNALVHTAPEPRNETCLTCHAKPNWKKRGASFSPRTDVHIAAGIRCVDCHAAGSRASDPRIRGREAHQFGKGDCPSGWVRNDLDDTVRACEDCHIAGWHNAPRASHAWLPPLHLEKLSCQACHIPTRAVKSALVQASDVFNPAPYIEPPGKRIWVFYDQEMNFWNHYGELEMFTVKDQPTNVTRPTLAVYKGKIYPVNRVHSAWVGWEEEGKPGLNMLFMRDFYGMWKAHRDSGGTEYPELSSIRDDDGDATVEVNRPEEIDALLAATKAHLAKTKFPLEGKRLVWVSDDRAYASSKEQKALPRLGHEATPYASVYKFSHDVAPAQAALGSGGCTDCHARGSSFFERPVLATAFSPEDASPRWIPNYAILGYSPWEIRLGAFREETLKPILYGVLAFAAGLIAILGLRELAVRRGVLPPRAARAWSWLALVAYAAAGAFVASSPGLAEYMTARRFDVDASHFWIASAVFLGALALALDRPARRRGAPGAAAVLPVIWALLVLTGISGGLVLLKLPALLGLTRWAYTGFDVGTTLLALGCVVLLALRLGALPRVGGGAPEAPETSRM